MSNGLCDNPVMKTAIQFMPVVELSAPVQIHMTNDLPTSLNSAKPNSAMPSTLQFQEIPIGQHFEFRGHRYRKLARNMASDEDRNGAIFMDQTEVLPDPFAHQAHSEEVNRVRR